MPSITAVGAAQPVYDLVCYFPDPAPFELPLPQAWTYNDANYLNAVGNRIQNKNEFAPFMMSGHGWAGGGTADMVGDISGGGTEASGMPLFRIASAGAGDAGSFDLNYCRAQGDYGNVRPLGAGFSWPSFYRVHHLTLNVTYRDGGGGLPDRETGILMMPGNNDTDYGWPVNAPGGTNRGGYGFVGDGGSGEWILASYDRTGVWSLFNSWALPPHDVTEWNTFDIVTVCQGPNRDAYVAMHFNGAKIMQATFASGVLEYAGRNNLEPDENWIAPQIRANDQAEIFIGPSSCRWGRFLPDGTELTS